MPDLRVKGLDTPLVVEAGTDLLTACRKQRVNVFWGPWARLLNCRGVGLCTLCKVDVMAGAENLTPRTRKEEKRLRRKPAHWRLACQAKIKGDVSIDPYPLVLVEERVSAEALDLARMLPEERQQIEREAKEAALATIVTEKREHEGLMARFRKKRESAAEGETAATTTKRRLPFGKRSKGAPDDADREAKAAAKEAAKEAEKRAKEAAKEAKRRAKDEAKAQKKGDKGAQQEEPVET